MDIEELGEPRMTMAQFEAEEAIERELRLHAGDCYAWATRDFEDCDCPVRLQGRWDEKDDEGADNGTA